MAAYVLVDIEVTDPENYEPYKNAVPEVVKKYGGRYLVRGGGDVPISVEIRGAGVRYAAAMSRFLFGGGRLAAPPRRRSRVSFDGRP